MHNKEEETKQKNNRRHGAAHDMHRMSSGAASGGLAPGIQPDIRGQRPLQHRDGRGKQVGPCLWVAVPFVGIGAPALPSRTKHFRSLIPQHIHSHRSTSWRGVWCGPVSPPHTHEHEHAYARTHNRFAAPLGLPCMALAKPFVPPLLKGQKGPSFAVLWMAGAWCMWGVRCRWPRVVWCGEGVVWLRGVRVMHANKPASNAPIPG